MILKFLHRTQWEAKLRRWGCKPLEGKGPLNTAEWWRGPHGLFTVPVERDGDRCDFWAIWNLCKEFGHSEDEAGPEH